jgi:hypothetical protein
VTAPDSSRLDAQTRALLLATLAKRIGEEQKLATAEFSTALAAGVTIRVQSPLGDPLGSVLRTLPKAEWRVVDRAALEAHLRTFPGCVEKVTSLLVPGIGWHEVDALDELAAICRQHAPHLLSEEEQVTAEAVTAAIEQSAATGSPAAPGIERVQPGGSIQVRPAKDASVAVERLVAAGLASWESLLPSAPKAVAS